MSLGQFFAILLVVTIWGANFTVIKLGLGEMPPILLSSLRFAFAALPTVFFLPRPRCRWEYVVGFGIVLGCIKFSLLFVGMDLGLSAGLASLVLQLQAFFTLMLGYFLLGEKVGPHRILAMIVAFSGVAVLLFVSDGSMTITGLLLVIAAAACAGCCQHRHETRRIGPDAVFRRLGQSGATDSAGHSVRPDRGPRQP